MRFWIVLNAPSMRPLHVGSAAPSSVPQTQQHHLNRDISHKMSAPTVTRGPPRAACDCGALCRWSSRTADSRAVLRPPTACLWRVSMNLGVFRVPSGFTFSRRLRCCWRWNMKDDTSSETHLIWNNSLFLFGWKQQSCSTEHSPCMWSSYCGRLLIETPPVWVHLNHTFPIMQSICVLAKGKRGVWDTFFFWLSWDHSCVSLSF